MIKTLITIVGPTGIGKTALSIAFAKAYSTHIISCDSRQFYKEMSIGTAVPSAEELSEAPHHFIQNKSIHERFTVGDFEKEALEIITKLFEANDVLIMVGGSALYEKAVTHGLDEFQAVSEEIKQHVQEKYEQRGLLWLQDELRLLDPVYFEEVDVQNAQRLLRAVSFIKSSGKKFSEQRTAKAKQRPFNVVKIGLEAARETLYNRINLRVDDMVAAGLIEEAISLEPHKELNALQTVGYREIYDSIATGSSMDDAISLIKQNTRRFAKRQLTWYRKETDVTWFNYKTCYTEIVEQVRKLL
ncbi:MAG: tRNA (adenosine(37)-N6)-dimethylallyltransferase MiaA [Nonlabens sp.]|nr:tRNA (adenosine(37)-N6)-dimethylallyltransferase MiaA [Nonlabens sp.]